MHCPGFMAIDSLPRDSSFPFKRSFLIHSFDRTVAAAVPVVSQATILASCVVRGEDTRHKQASHAHCNRILQNATRKYKMMHADA